MYVCMYVCMYACMHANVCKYACMHACMHACMYVCMYVCKAEYLLRSFFELLKTTSFFLLSLIFDDCLLTKHKCDIKFKIPLNTWIA